MIMARLVALLFLCCSLTSPVLAQGWGRLVPFQRVANKPATQAPARIELTENDGPWFILAHTFMGEVGREKAIELAEELRATNGMQAYVHRKVIDLDETVIGLGVDKYGKPKRMKHRNTTDYEGYAVLIGDFASVDDPRLQDTLEQVKHLNPRCISENNSEGTDQAISYYRYGYKKVQERLGLTDRSSRGAMGNAFVTRNPLLPEEYFAPKGIDPFVMKMNEGVEHSLLKCPKPFSVKVATFRGNISMKPAEANAAGLSNKLAEAAENAHRMVEELRKLGYEAYEFHDRHESIVAIGSFDDVGRPRADGRLEMHPQVHTIIETFKAQPLNIPGLQGGLQPRQIAGISFDVQPMPVGVPQRSIATDYARGPFGATR